MEKPTSSSPGAPKTKPKGPTLVRSAKSGTFASSGSRKLVKASGVHSPAEKRAKVAAARIRAAKAEKNVPSGSRKPVKASEALPPNEKRVKKSASRTENIALRARSADKDLIDRAAVLAGVSRTEFILRAARRDAEVLLLERRVFSVSSDDYDAFLAALEEPPAADDKLRELMNSKPLWEQ